MITYRITIDAGTQSRLLAISQALNRTVEDLIESATEEAALNHFRHRDDDPARQSKSP